MNDAGRIGFVIKGDYNDLEAYDFLDVVFYNKSSYVAKKSTIGNKPERNNEYWHILAEGSEGSIVGSEVTGVKGEAEENYRQGNVNLTPENIGLGNVPNVVTNDQTPTFTQATTRTNILSGEKLSVLFGKIMKWFADLKAVAFSGSYNDLSDQPEIPTKTSQLINDSGFKTTDTTYSTMTGATASAAGKAGLVPAPAAGKQNAYFRGDGTYVTTSTTLTGTVQGIPLDQTMGKALDDKITALNNSLIQTLPGIVALDATVALKDGIGTVINENIKSTSKIFVTRKHSAVVTGAFFAAQAYDGYATISLNSQSTASAIYVYILIVND